MKNIFAGKAGASLTEKQERQMEILFLVLVGAFMFAWAAVQPLNFSPDEFLRNKVVMYLFNHNRLPHGGDPEVMDASWGISYAFYPMLTYMVSYVYMKIVSIFTMNSHALLVAARMAEVSFGVGSAYFTMKIGKRFFRDGYEKMFLFLVTFLPGAFVLFSYINCDSLALFATSMLIYSWVRGLEDGWSLRTCMLTAAGVSVCALSYYNAYGVILATVLVFVCSILFAEEKRWNFKKMLQRGLFITAIVAVLAGWWFARNYVLYDGDMLGLNITTVYAEKYADDFRKPSNRYTFQDNPDASVFDMMIYQPENHLHNWTLMVYYSFIGCFGYMTIWPPEWIGKLFMMVFLVGILGVLMRFGELFWFRRAGFKQRLDVAGSRMKVRCTYRRDRWSRQAIFHWGLVITMVSANVLNIYNSYANDYQPQGRYSMPMLIPFMYFITLGYRNLFERFGKGKKAARIFCGVVCCGMLTFILYCYFGLVLPHSIAMAK